MKMKKLLTILTLVMVVLFAGCKKDDFVEIVGVCPVVVSTSPANGAASVPLDKIITATFNEKMNPATITQESFTLEVTAKGAASVAGTVSYSGTTASFTPSSALTPNSTYTGRVTTAAKDLMASALQTDYVWTFVTGTTLAPTVISTDPANNATNVFLNKKITATFSEPMDPLTLTATTFTIKHGATSVTGTVSYAGTTATFTASTAFTSNTIYTGTISFGAKNVQGTTLANDYVWTFTTGTITAPTVTSTDPANNAINVVLNKKITAIFSEAMDPLTLTGTTFTIKQGVTPVAGTVSYAGTTASFTLFSSLSINTTYTATITTGAKNVSGVPLANNYIWTFSTGASINPLGVDLKTVAQFGIIAGVGVSNNAGFSVIQNMDVGISPGFRSSITGFSITGGPGIIVNGKFYASDDIAPPGVPAMLIQAKQDLTDAYLFAEGATSPAPVTIAGDQGGKTLAPGIYKSTSTLLIQSGNLTLDAQGDANAVWIFQIASNFTTIGGAGGSVILAGGAQAKNVYWQTGSSATIGDYTSFNGNVLALTSITMNSHAVAVGRMLARNGAVTLTSTNIIIKP